MSSLRLPTKANWLVCRLVQLQFHVGVILSVVMGKLALGLASCGVLLNSLACSSPSSVQPELKEDAGVARDAASDVSYVEVSSDSDSPCTYGLLVEDVCVPPPSPPNDPCFGVPQPCPRQCPTNGCPPRTK